MYVHALHTVHTLPDLRITGGRLGDGFLSRVALHCDKFESYLPVAKCSHLVRTHDRAIDFPQEYAGQLYASFRVAAVVEANDSQLGSTILSTRIRNAGLDAAKLRQAAAVIAQVGREISREVGQGMRIRF